MTRLIEKPSFIDSSGGDNPRRVYHYQVIGTQQEGTARVLAGNALGPVISTPFGTLFRADISCTSTAYDHWDVDVEYQPRPKDIGTWTWDLDGTGAVEHITHSLETIAGYKVGGTLTISPSPYGNAIGFENGQIAGADVVVPASKFSVTFTHPSGVMSLPYAKYLSDLAGYVNQNAWLVWQAGEVRFLGPRASDGSQSQSTVVYQFEISKNRTGIPVGGITGIAKQGWDIAWVKSAPGTVSIGGENFPTNVPQFVLIERVQYRVDFATAFGISS